MTPPNLQTPRAAQPIAPPKPATQPGANVPTQTRPTPALPQGQQAASAIPVPVWLWVGIFFLPFVFAWFLLQRGHSVQNRVIAFTWMVGYLGHMGRMEEEEKRKAIRAAQQSALTESTRDLPAYSPPTREQALAGYALNLQMRGGTCGAIGAQIDRALSGGMVGGIDSPYMSNMLMQAERMCGAP